MATAKAAATVSLSALAKSVDAAVKTAAARHELVVDNATLLDRWEIIGRRLRDVGDINIAYRFARDVTSAVRMPGLKIEPAVARIGRDTWVGFIERARLPRAL